MNNFLDNYVDEKQNLEETKLINTDLKMIEIDNLPEEIFHMIFANMSSREVWRCRRVSRRWRSLVDNLPETTWQAICCRKYGNRTIDISRSRIAWKEMSRSLYLWKHIKHANYTVKILPLKNITDFQILDDGTVAVTVANSQVSSIWGPIITANAIIYYNLDTLEKIKEKKFNYSFWRYQENRTFIAYCDIHDDIHIFLKENAKDFVVGKIQTEFFNISWPMYSLGRLNCEYISFTMFDDEIVFQNSELIICIAKVLKDDGKWSVKVEQKGLFRQQAIVFSYATDENTSDDIFLLDEFNSIYRLRDNNFEKVCSLFSATGCSPIEIMLNYGFDWTKDRNFQWLMNYVAHSQKTDILCDLENTSACWTSEAVLFGIKDKISIHLDDSNFFYTAKPIRVIDISKYIDFQCRVVKMSVLERVNGHRLIALVSHVQHGKTEICIIDFNHLTPVTPVERVRQKPTLKVRKLLKRKAKPIAQHRYYTRASVKGKKK